MHSAATKLRARELLDLSGNDSNSLNGQWLTENRIALSQAHSWTLLEAPHRAVKGFQSALRELPNKHRRGRGVYLARSALAHAGDQQVDHADAVPAVADFRSAMKDTVLHQA
jgi:hypothetical protein